MKCRKCNIEMVEKKEMIKIDIPNTFPSKIIFKEIKIKDMKRGDKIIYFSIDNEIKILPEMTIRILIGEFHYKASKNLIAKFNEQFFYKMQESSNEGLCLGRNSQLSSNAQNVGSNPTSCNKDRIIIRNKKTGETHLGNLSELFELTIEDRCNKINELMECISLYDRQFFSFGKKLAKFSIEKGDIYYTPEYMVDKFKVILRSEHPMWKSSHGSCLRQQLINFTHYIKFGTLISLFDTYWGYSKQNLQKIHNKAKKLGLIKRAYI